MSSSDARTGMVSAISLQTNRGFGATELDLLVDRFKAIMQGPGGTDPLLTEAALNVVRSLQFFRAECNKRRDEIAGLERQLAEARARLAVTDARVSHAG